MERRIALILFLLFSSAIKAQPYNIVQEFYVPVPSEDIVAQGVALVGTTGASLSTTMHNVVGLTSTVDMTMGVNDYWEAGFERDITSPVQAINLIVGHVAGVIGARVQRALNVGRV